MFLPGTKHGFCLIRGSHGILEESACTLYSGRTLEISQSVGYLWCNGKVETPIVNSLIFRIATIFHLFLPEASSFLGITKVGEFQRLVLACMISSCNSWSVCLRAYSLRTSGIRYGLKFIPRVGSIAGVGVACSAAVVNGSLSPDNQPLHCTSRKS
jgi:hypothetical protein